MEESIRLPDCRARASLSSDVRISLIAKTFDKNWPTATKPRTSRSRSRHVTYRCVKLSGALPAEPALAKTRTAL